MLVRGRRGSIPEDVIDDVRTRSDIVEVISECGVALRPAGRDYKGLCPFHDEKTPSFTVSPSKQIFYCFGCQKGGNVISFVREHEAKSFIESVEWLAARLNISLPESGGHESVARKRFQTLEDLNRFAVSYYTERLTKEPEGASALAYLTRRGVQPKVMRDFKLGYAPSGGRELIRAATSEGYTIQQLIDAGLIKDGDRGPQSRFWNRVLFPINNERGVPIGFGGRALSDEQQPKYLNTPATTLYDKSRVLYNLDRARQPIYRRQQVLLVEGYMDVLMLCQSGIENVVASSGTSLSEEHALLLKRFAPEVVIVYDGDASGFEAAGRGLNRLLGVGLQVRVALLPAGEDPDSFTRREGAEGFRALTARAINLIEFQIQASIQRQDMHRVDVKAGIVREVVETLLNVTDRVALREYVRYAGRELHVEESVIWGALRDSGFKGEGVSGNRQVRKKREERVPVRVQIERQLLAALVWHPGLIGSVKSEFHYEDFTHPVARGVSRLLWEASDELGDESGSVDIDSVLDKCSEERLTAFISSVLLKQAPPARLLAARVAGCLKKLQDFLLKDLEQRVRSHASSEGADEYETLAALVELSNQRRALRVAESSSVSEDMNLKEGGVDDGF